MSEQFSLTENDATGRTFRLRRHFFSPEEFTSYVEAAGFVVSTVTSVDERLFKDFKRTVLDTRTDNLVELVATKP